MRTVHASVEVAAPPSAAWAHELVAAAGARHGLRGAVAGAARELAAGTIDAAGDRRRRDEQR